MSNHIRLISTLLGKEDVLSTGKPAIQQRGEENVEISPIKLSELEFERDGKVVKAKDFFVLLEAFKSLEFDVSNKNSVITDFLSRIVDSLQSKAGITTFKNIYDDLVASVGFNELKIRRDYSDFYNQFSLDALIQEIEQFSDIVGNELVNNLNAKVSLDLLANSGYHLFPFNRDNKLPSSVNKDSWDFISNKSSIFTDRINNSYYIFNQAHLLFNSTNTVAEKDDFFPYLGSLKFTKDYKHPTTRSPYTVRVASQSDMAGDDYSSPSGRVQDLNRASVEIRTVRDLVSESDWSSDTNKNTLFLKEVLGSTDNTTAHESLYTKVTGFKGRIGVRQTLEFLKSDGTYVDEFEVDKDNGYYYKLGNTVIYTHTKTFYQVPVKLTKVEVQFPFRVVHVFHNDSDLTIPKNFVLAIPEAVDFPIITASATLVKSDVIKPVALTKTNSLSIPISYYDYDFKNYVDVTSLLDYENEQYYQYYELEYAISSFKPFPLSIRIT